MHAYYPGVNNEQINTAHVPETTATYKIPLAGNFTFPVKHISTGIGKYGDVSESPGVRVHYGIPDPGLAIPTDDPFTSIGPGLIYGLGRAGLGYAGEKLFMSSSTNRVFWVGGSLAKAEATSFAQQSGGVTLGMTRAGQVMERVTVGLERVTSQSFAQKTTTPMWRFVSRVHAGFAEGEANTFMYLPMTRSTSIYFTDELPVLTRKGIGLSTTIVNL